MKVVARAKDGDPRSAKRLRRSPRIQELEQKQAGTDIFLPPEVCADTMGLLPAADMIRFSSVSRRFLQRSRAPRS